MLEKEEIFFMAVFVGGKKVTSSQLYLVLGSLCQFSPREIMKCRGNNECKTNPFVNRSCMSSRDTSVVSEIYRVEHKCENVDLSL